jgi:phage FluMu protein Com
MKTNTLRLFCSTIAFGVLAAIASAGSDLQSYQTLRSPEQFKQLKAGDRVAYVCNECKTVSEVTIESPEHAMELCKEGASVMCPTCKTKTKVTMKSQRNDQPTQTAVVYVNEKGEECLFVAKISDKK